MSRIVVALGGNALLRRGEAAEAESQRRNVSRAAAALADLADGVPSPQPREIVEPHAIETLRDDGSIAVCAGGGGIPVVRDGARLRGVEAVIDKDLTAALLAERLHADRLVLLTDVPYVERGWGTAAAAPIRDATPAELRELDFAAGSMAPTIEAACRFVEHTGGDVAIGGLAELADVAARRCGTRVHGSAP